MVTDYAEGELFQILEDDGSLPEEQVQSLTTMHPSLVLVQPRKTRLCLTERLLMGRKESNQTNKLVRIANREDPDQTASSEAV